VQLAEKERADAKAATNKALIDKENAVKDLKEVEV